MLIPEDSTLTLAGAVYRVAEGAAERVPVVRYSGLKTLRGRGFTLVATAASGERKLYEDPLPKRSILLFGAEGAEVEISAAEFDLLALFARHPNRPLNRDQIMEQAHNRGWDVFDRSIDLRVMRLRRKVERNADKPEVIKTVRNVGYVYVPRT